MDWTNSRETKHQIVRFIKSNDDLVRSYFCNEMLHTATGTALNSVPGVTHNSKVICRLRCRLIFRLIRY